MQRIYFQEISRTQRKSIIEVRQVLSKYPGYLVSSAPLPSDARRAFGIRESLALCQARDWYFSRGRRGWHEECNGRREGGGITGIYIYGEKTIKFSHIAEGSRFSRPVLVVRMRFALPRREHTALSTSVVRTRRGTASGPENGSILRRGIRPCRRARAGKIVV